MTGIRNGLALIARRPRILILITRIKTTMILLAKRITGLSVAIYNLNAPSHFVLQTIEVNLPLLLVVLGVVAAEVLAVLVLFLSNALCIRDGALVTVMDTGCELVVVTQES